MFLNINFQQYEIFSQKKTNKINEMNLNLHMNAASLLQLPPWQQLLSTHGQLPVTVPFTSSRGLKPYRSVKFSERSNNNSCISTERRELPNLRTGKQLKERFSQSSYWVLWILDLSLRCDLDWKVKHWLCCQTQTSCNQHLFSLSVNLLITFLIHWWKWWNN